MRIRIKGDLFVRVRIIGDATANDIMRWWYAERVGEEFEVEQCPKFEKYWRTKEEVVWTNNGGHTAHILKSDCELIDDTLSHGTYEVTKLISEG
ncbi:hypothetical protein SAMN04487909_109103 [Aneurinibacillus migulanus]|uniref:Uncharacterized protein n=1 Tax=Aneurinibacillus migulanus TaxID=47500 RepID=A0A1G8PIC8_ANEMI|nr:hypothetical protein SAMN04487909_109103 [Aneurinibacillus migulanus]